MKSKEDRRLDAMRRLAAFEVTAAEESRAKLIDEHSAAFRWMIASLFALNGGAILTIFGTERLGVQPVLPAFWVFFAGVVATFLAVLFGQLSDRAMIAQMHKWGLYWTTVASLDERDESQENSIKQYIENAERWGRWARIQAIFAMIFFVLGVLTAVVLEQKSEIARLEAVLDRSEADARRISAAIDELETKSEEVRANETSVVK
jgi:hypothetical protein